MLRRRNFSVKEAYSLDMEIMQAKELVVRAGKQLVESGLIARTWGNVSCRVSDTQFVITPPAAGHMKLLRRRKSSWSILQI